VTHTWKTATRSPRSYCWQSRSYCIVSVYRMNFGSPSVYVHFANGWSPNCFSSLFSRSYCYTVWSAVGVILSSVCPSVCDAVHSGSIQG